MHKMILKEIKEEAGDWKMGWKMVKNEEGTVTKADLIEKLPAALEAIEKAKQEKWEKEEKEMEAEMAGEWEK